MSLFRSVDHAPTANKNFSVGHILSLDVPLVNASVSHYRPIWGRHTEIQEE
ncbi:MAG TPA: hypothetical protein G4O12_01955 [Dehalococcoidia bacterium]|nr:hypothetical protein [Dehalococcoidia bacterium]